MKKDKTVGEAVALVIKTGGVTINPLQRRPNPYKSACFVAAKLGLDCGRFHFYPLNIKKAP